MAAALAEGDPPGKLGSTWMLGQVAGVTPRPALAELFPAPDWLPHRFHPSQRLVRLVRFDESHYRDAPFLDDRCLRDDIAATMVHWSDAVAAIPAGARRDAHFLFHLGHVGSTLISRLLAECGDILPLREPLPLLGATWLPAAERAARIEALTALYSRTFRAGQRAMIKATSSVSEIATDLLNHTTGKAAIIIMRPEPFIAARLAANTAELTNRADERWERLAGRAPQLAQTAPPSIPARLAAMSWATEASAMEQAALRIEPDRLRFVDFDDFLRESADSLADLTAHFDLTAPRSQIDAIIAGPLMNRSSKRLDRAFSTRERRARIAAAAAHHRDDIAEALRWLETMAMSAPTVAAALDRAGG